MGIQSNYKTPEAASEAARQRLALEGRPRHEVVAVFELPNGEFEVGTWPAGRTNEMPPGAWVVR